MNIVEMLLKLLTGGDTLGNIASMLGIGQEQAGKAVHATVPSLLAGLTAGATKPGGGAALADALAKQDPGVVDNVSSLFSSGGTVVASQGSNVLGSLLGGSTLNQISGVLSRFTGLDEANTSKLLGWVAPVVLGVLGRHSKGMDAAGIVSMLVGQKDNILSAMPSGLASMLSSAVPGLGSVLGGTSRATTPVDRIHVSSGAPRHGEPSAPSVLKWLIPLVIACLLLFFLPRMYRRSTENQRNVKEPAAETTPMTDESTKLISDGYSLIKDATENVASITDEASATAALPKLQGITTKLGGIQTALAKLPQPVQKTVVDALRPLVAKLRETAQPVLALPVVGAKVKPTVDELLGQIDRIMATPETPSASAP